MFIMNSKSCNRCCCCCVESVADGNKEKQLNERKRKKTKKLVSKMHINEDGEMGQIASFCEFLT